MHGHVGATVCMVVVQLYSYVGPPSLNFPASCRHSQLLPRDSALGQLVAYLKSLAYELERLGHKEPLSVPPSVMLACYDGQGAFYKPHMDSSGTDPRRLTAIVYLVPPDWDAAPSKDGGQLVWWLVDEYEQPKYGTARNCLDPRAGRLVLFNARTVMHEVLPTHRKRFALTLWYFSASDHQQSASTTR